MQIDNDGLTLIEAAQRWCPSELTEEIRTQERCLTRHELDRLEWLVQLTPNTERRKAAPDDWLASGSGYGPLLTAWRELERCLKHQISAGIIRLHGVQVRPEMRVEVEQIPGAWGDELVLDLEANAVAIEALRFTAIRCTLRPSIGIGQTAAAAHTESASYRAEDKPNPRGRLSGRPSFKDMIAADLRVHGPAIRQQAQANPGKRPVWAELARVIHRRMQKQQRQGGGAAIPDEETIRKHLPDLYDRLLGETAGQ